MKPLLFDSRRLPGRQHGRLREQLATEHDAEPFSPVDTRATVRRVIEVSASLGLRTQMYRGTLDLRGTEIDHVWASVGGVVVDAAFPVLDADFVDVLRRFVAGELTSEDLAEAADEIAFTRRVVGEFPPPLRYLGAPLWVDRQKLLSQRRRN